MLHHWPAVTLLLLGELAVLLIALAVIALHRGAPRVRGMARTLRRSLRRRRQTPG